MNKRHLHHLWTRFRAIKPWYFLAVALVSSVICVLALRANNQHMLVLREAVYTADADDKGTQEALNALQAYVTAHMNTRLDSGPNPVYPPIQLKYTYDRLVQAGIDGQVSSNNTLNAAAETYCQQQNPNGYFGAYRVSCIQQYIKDHATAANATPPPIPEALYKYSFVSPSWSPDFAGWSLLLAILAAVSFLISLVVSLFFKRQLK